jgi:adenylate kinase
MRLVLIGPPGVGKGTQAQRIAETLSVPQVATGDILREAVRTGAPLGKEAESYMKKGALVPDSVVIGIIRERLQRDDCRKGFLLDGFPRTIEQVRALEAMLKGAGLAIEGVLSFTAPRETIIERLSGRRTCTKCGNMHHVKFSPPVKEGICVKCGAPLIQRPDDNPKSIAERLDVFEKQTAPVVAEYRKQGLLQEIPAAGAPEAIFADVMKRLKPRGADH